MGQGEGQADVEEKLEKFEVAAIAACPLSKVFAVGGKNGETRVYAGLTGKVLVTLQGHTGAVTAIGFRPDGKRVVTGSADKTARVWDAGTGNELAVLKGHTDAVIAVSSAPAAKWLPQAAGTRRCGCGRPLRNDSPQMANANTRLSLRVRGASVLHRWVSEARPTTSTQNESSKASGESERPVQRLKRYGRSIRSVSRRWGGCNLRLPRRPRRTAGRTGYSVA